MNIATMKIVLYANCQADGIAHFLKKTPLAAEIKVWHNWQVLMKEQPLAGLLDDLRSADVLIFQPCRDGYICVDNVHVPGTDELIQRYVRPGCALVSFAYQFNHGFFPILKVAPGRAGFITGDDVLSWHNSGALREYDADCFIFDCARRFIECLAEQSRREALCSVRMADWILGNYQEKRLFLTQNHPSSGLFVELTKRIMTVMGQLLPDYWDKVYFSGLSSEVENEAGLPGTLPVHPAVVRELGLKYGPSPDSSYYRTLLQDLLKEP